MLIMLGGSVFGRVGGAAERASELLSGLSGPPDLIKGKHNIHGVSRVTEEVINKLSPLNLGLQTCNCDYLRSSC